MPLEFPPYSAITKAQYRDTLQAAIDAQAVRRCLQMADKQGRYLRPRVVRSPWRQVKEHLAMNPRTIVLACILGAALWFGMWMVGFVVGRILGGARI